MSMSKHNAPIVSTKDHQEMDKSKPGEVILHLSTKSIDDLPPELLTTILEFLTLDANRNTTLSYRRVNPQWKEILDTLIEKKIVSGQFPAFPDMKIKGFSDQSGVRVSPMRFLAGRNPFPFNSLLCNRSLRESYRYSDQKPSSFPMMSLPAFASKFGGNLTTFALHQYNLPLCTLIELLSSMSNLKRLRFQDVLQANTITELTDVLPNPPPLPFLKTLEVYTGRISSDSSNGIDIMYVWLIASYADQLVHLELQTSHRLPPFQANHQYSHSTPSGDTYSIATTSESAFRNLKELKVFRASRDFFILSETPALQRLSVKKTLFCENHFDLGDVVVFIEKCRSTLATLSLEITWNDLVSRRLMENYLDGGQLLQVKAGAVAVKTLVIPYPISVLPEMALCNLLLQFPALEALQLVHFQSYYLESLFSVVPQNVNEEAVEFVIKNNQNAHEIEALKERLPPLFQQLAKDLQNDYFAGLAVMRLNGRLNDAIANGRVEEIDAGNAQIRQMVDEIEESRRGVSAVQNERAAIFKRLAALGGNIKKILVQQLLERGGFWNTCPSLKTVSVSSGEKPDGDVCVFRRGE